MTARATPPTKREALIRIAIALESAVNELRIANQIAMAERQARIEDALPPPRPATKRKWWRG